MSDQPQGEESALLQEYRDTVLVYEAISAEIAALLEENDGGTEKMTDEEYLRYREMAHRRDVLYDALKRLEVKLLGEE